MNTEEKLEALTAEAEAALADTYKRIDDTAYYNTRRVMERFAEHRVSAAHLYPSDGYGYGDRGRDTLDEIYAELFGTEAAFVRHSITSGTHALTIGLFGLLRPNDTLLCVTGKPYDTLDEVISGGDGSLADFGIKNKIIELRDSGIDYNALEAALADKSVKVVYAQRSRGYSSRRTLTVAEINELADFSHKRCGAFVVVDNCYGEFCERAEPSHADMIIGSLIKNPGGGLADCGGYIAGTRRAVELAAGRLTTPSTGLEVGATIGQNKNLYRGLFYAPHTVAQALKTAHFAAYIFSSLGYPVSPLPLDERSDIIQTVSLGTEELLCAFCRGIQAGSPIDAYVTPEPWDMPGYTDKVIMAAGTFVGGASIELSADGPLRPPYTAFFQGGLTYESGKIGIIKAAAFLERKSDKEL